MATSMSDEVLKLAEDVEMKTKQCDMFAKMYEMSKETAKRPPPPSGDTVKADPRMVVGPHDRLAEVLDPPTTGEFVAFHAARRADMERFKAWCTSLPTEGAPEEDVNLARRYELALQAGRAKLTDMRARYPVEIGGLASQPADADIQLILVTCVGKEESFRIRAADELAAVKAKIQRQSGRPMQEYCVFVHPRRQDAGVVYATQIYGLTALLDESTPQIMPRDERHRAWDKINGSAGYALWKEADTAASLGLHDGTKGLIVEARGGRSPLCSVEEQRKQDALATAYMKADVNARALQTHEDLQGSGVAEGAAGRAVADDASVPAAADGGGAGAEGCCLLQ